MTDWDDLVASAILGSARTSAQERFDESNHLTRMIEAKDLQSVEAQVLLRSAVVWLWQQSGAVPVGVDWRVAGYNNDEDMGQCSAEAARYVPRLLAGEKKGVLIEWLSALHVKGVSLPYQWLPEFLDLAAADDRLRSYVLPVLGPKGEWLATQNPQWNDLISPSDVVDTDLITQKWEIGSLQERIEYLRRFRLCAADNGRQLLISDWKKNRAQERSALLSELSYGLNENDEDFLESVLDDRSKEVRKVAVALLRRLPESKLGKRMYERLKGALRLEKKSGILQREKLLIAPPEDFSPGMERDGIIENPPSGLDTSTWWFVQMLSAVPPGIWTSMWDKKPADLISLAMNEKYGRYILEGWSGAAAHMQDAEWAEALVKQWIARPWHESSKSVFFVENLTTLLDLVSQEELESWLVSILQGTRNPASVLLLLRNHKRSWGQRVSIAFINRLHSILRIAEYQQTTVWLGVLSDSVLTINYLEVERIEKLIDDKITHWQRIRLEEVVDIVRLRFDALSSL